MFQHRGLECKSRNSRDTWNNRQLWPWNTKWSRAKANRVLPKVNRVLPLVIANTRFQQHEMTLHMDTTRWLILKPGWLYSLQLKMEKLNTVSKNKTGSWLWLRSWTPYCKIQTSLEESRENHWTIQFSSVTRLYLTLCDPMSCSTPGFLVHQQLLELAQTHAHWVGDDIQPSYQLSSPSPPVFNLSQHQGLFQWVSSLHQVAKILELQLQNQSFWLIFRTDFL